MREKGITDLEKIEPSGLDSFDQAATQALEEFRSSFTMPPDFPRRLRCLLLKVPLQHLQQRLGRSSPACKVRK